jgi:hypothetical protein
MIGGSAPAKTEVGPSLIVMSADGATLSFNLDAVKAEIEEAIRKHAGQ